MGVSRARGGSRGHRHSAALTSAKRRGRGGEGEGEAEEERCQAGPRGVSRQIIEMRTATFPLETHPPHPPISSVFS